MLNPKWSLILPVGFLLLPEICHAVGLSGADTAIYNYLWLRACRVTPIFNLKKSVERV